MQIKYKIREFDEANKTIIVDYEDGQWARIQLTLPFPKDKAELEARIAEFTAPAEAIEAKDATVNLTFIKKLVGRDGKTNRKRLREVSVEPVSEADQQAERDAERTRADDMLNARINALIEVALEERSANVV